MNKFLKYKLMSAAKKSETFLRKASDLAGTVIEVSKAPNVTSISAAAIVGLHNAVDYFANGGGDDYKNAIPVQDPNVGLVANALTECQVLNMAEHNSWRIKAYALPSGGCISHHSQGSSHAFFLEEGTVEDFYEDIRNILWNKSGTRMGFTTSGSEFDQALTVYPYTLGEALRSDESRNIVERVKKYANKNFNRSMVLCGPPGTGKSTMVRAIGDDLKYATLFLEGWLLPSLNANGLKELCRLLKPECVIIDDLDRASNASNMLDQIEVLKQSVKIVLITVNDFRKLGTALLRPGRVDELVQIERVFTADCFVEELSNHPELNKEISQWPIAFIHEFKTRIAVEGLNKAIKDLDGLRLRVERNNNPNNLNPNDFLLKVNEQNK